jgi:hypothetical protein
MRHQTYTVKVIGEAGELEGLRGCICSVCGGLGVAKTASKAAEIMQRHVAKFTRGSLPRGVVGWGE